MVENENYKSYTANNGTELRFPKESVVQMTAEQRDCYQNFINVLAQILIKYAAAEKENQKKGVMDNEIRIDNPRAGPDLQ